MLNQFDNGDTAILRSLSCRFDNNIGKLDVIIKSRTKDTLHCIKFVEFCGNNSGRGLYI